MLKATAWLVLMSYKHETFKLKEQLFTSLPFADFSIYEALTIYYIGQFKSALTDTPVPQSGSLSSL